MNDLNDNRSDVIIYTEMIVREDDISLCGFSSQRELDIFKQLITVNGIGTKVALGILSNVHYMELMKIIIKGDPGPLTKVPGVGKKTAQRIILELKDKLQKMDVNFTYDADVVYNDYEEYFHVDALEALLSLGYSKIEAKEALKDIDKDLPVEEIVKQALKRLMK